MMANTLDIKVDDISKESSIALVVLEGVIDAITIHQFRESMERIVNDQRYRIIMDLSGLSFINSSGLGVLLASLRAAESRGGDIKLVGVKPGIRKVLEVAGFTDFFQIVMTLNDAIRSLGNR